MGCFDPLFSDFVDSASDVGDTSRFPGGLPYDIDPFGVIEKLTGVDGISTKPQASGIAQGISDGTVAGIFHGATGLLDGTVAMLGAWLNSMKMDVVENGAAIALLGSVEATSPATPLWVADENDMATQPRENVKTWSGTFTTNSDSHTHTINGNTASGGSGDSAHTHGNGTLSTVSNSHNHSVVISQRTPLFTPSVQKDVPDFDDGGKIYMMPLPVDREGLLTRLSWIVGADSSLLDINTYNMGVYVYNPETETSGWGTGNIEMVWSSSNLAATLAATTSEQETEVSLGLTSEQGWCRPGQLLFVAHHQRAPGLIQTPRSFAYAPTNTRPRPASRRLRYAMYMTSAWYDALPSSIAFSGLSGINWGCGWAALTVDSTATPPEEP